MAARSSRLTNCEGSRGNSAAAPAPGPSFANVLVNRGACVILRPVNAAIQYTRTYVSNQFRIWGWQRLRGRVANRGNLRYNVQSLKGTRHVMQPCGTVRPVVRRRGDRSSAPADRANGDRDKLQGTWTGKIAGGPPGGRRH